MRSASARATWATPGIGSAGHLFRTDGVVLMPLVPLQADALPSVAAVAAKLAAALPARGAEAAA